MAQNPIKSNFIQKSIEGQAVQQNIEGKMQAGEGAAAALRLANDFLLWLAVDARTKSDALKIEREVAALFKGGARGVLIARHMGNTPDPAGNMHSTYLGLTVVGSGNTEDEAVKNLQERKRKEAEKQKPVEETSCTPSNPTGQSSESRSATLKALPEGYNFAYGSQVANETLRFYEKNPRNEKSTEGNPFQRAYVDQEYIFLSYNDWGNYLALIRRQRK